MIHCILQTPHCNFQVGYFIYCNFSFYGKSTTYETYFTFFFSFLPKLAMISYPVDVTKGKLLLTAFANSWSFPLEKDFVGLLQSEKILSPHTRSLIGQMILEFISLLTIPSFVGWRYFYLDNDFLRSTRLSKSSDLTHSFPMHPFSTPWKHQKTLLLNSKP